MLGWCFVIIWQAFPLSWDGKHDALMELFTRRDRTKGGDVVGGVFGMMWEEPRSCQIREQSIEGGVRVTITSLSSQGWCVWIIKAQKRRYWISCCQIGSWHLMQCIQWKYGMKSNHDIMISTLYKLCLIIKCLHLLIPIIHSDGNVKFI